MKRHLKTHRNDSNKENICTLLANGKNSLDILEKEISNRLEEKKKKRIFNIEKKGKKNRPSEALKKTNTAINSNFIPEISGKFFPESTKRKLFQLQFNVNKLQNIVNSSPYY